MNTVSVVLVTNVGQGFGRAIALAYGQADYDVVCADRDVDLASKTAAEIEELGGQAIPIQTSMTTSAEVRKAFDKVFEIFGDLSGVVHVANFDSRTPFGRLSEGELSELMEETIYSTLVTLKAASRYLEHAWIVLVGPPLNAREPQMAAVQGALEHVTQRYRDTVNLTINLVVPSRAASDPFHDAPLVDNVMYLGATNKGVNGQRMIVKLPPPPRVIESLLPEVRAALDDSMSQEELEASVFMGLASLREAASNSADASSQGFSASNSDEDDTSELDDDLSEFDDDLADDQSDELDDDNIDDELDDANDDDNLDDEFDDNYDELDELEADDNFEDDDDDDDDIEDDDPSSPYSEHYAEAPLEADADDALYVANTLNNKVEDDDATEDDDADISYYGDYDYYNDYNELEQDSANPTSSAPNAIAGDDAYTYNDADSYDPDSYNADSYDADSYDDAEDEPTSTYPRNLKRQVRN
jgi:NAD(P)-dependent dehydrogenase (short-subunit alcohol dehydrogenase family)